MSEACTHLMMRIVYFIDHLRPDGTQKVLEQLIEGLAAQNHDQAVVCLNDSWDCALVNRLREAQAEVRIVGKVALASGYGLISTWQWLRRRRFDVAVTFLFASDVVGRVLARVAGVPRIVSSPRARNTHYAGWQHWLVRRTMRWVDAVVINSAGIRDFAVIEEGAPGSKIHVIHNGVKAEDYLEPLDRAALCSEFDLSPERCLIGAVGRLTHQKGFDVLLRALSLINREDIILLMIGRGEHEASLRAQADKLGLRYQVHFAGYRRDVPRLLGALDLYVHPARFEGMPNALLEAMAAGCPIVASFVDGICELIEDGVHGWLVPAEDADALAGAMQTALNDRTEGKRRAAAAQRRVATQFHVDAMVAAWEAVLCGLS